MPIKLEWDETKSVAHAKFIDDWRWTDYESVYLDFLKHVEQVDYDVYFIGDVRESSPLPPNTIMHGARALRRLPPNVKLSVLVGPDSFMRSITQVFLKLFEGLNHRTVIADTIDEAHHIIAQHKQHRPKKSD